MKKLIAIILTSCLMTVAASAGYYQITYNYVTKEHRVIDLSSGTVVASFSQGITSGGVFQPIVWDPQNILHVGYDLSSGVISISIN